MYTKPNTSHLLKAGLNFLRSISLRHGSSRSPIWTHPKLQAINRELGQTLKSKHISGLDALRALAVTLVLIDHFGLSDYVLGSHVGLGSLGVMIFFVLSGFLITSMLLRENRTTGGISLSDFYRRRAYRIFPTFYCCWILTTVVECLVHQFHWRTAVVSFFYLMDYGRALAPESLQRYLHMWISWSLAVEEKFYFFWPLLLVFLLKRPQRLIRVLTAIILGQWVYRTILYLFFNLPFMYLYHTFDMRVDSILIGCLLAIIVENPETRYLCCVLLRWRLLILFPLLVLALLTGVSPNNKLRFLVAWSAQPALAAIMLLQIVYWGSKSWTICASGVVKMTARLSYGLYLYHPLASQIVYLLHPRHLGYYAAALTLPMATASYYVIELPFMALRDRRGTTPPRHNSPTPAQPDLGHSDGGGVVLS